MGNKAREIVRAFRQGPADGETEIDEACERILLASQALSQSCLMLNSLDTDIDSPRQQGLVQLKKNGACIWIYADAESQSCIIIDPVESLGDRLEKFVQCQGYQVKAILDTHSHADHESCRPMLQTILQPHFDPALSQLDPLGWPQIGTQEVSLVDGQKVPAIVINNNKVLAKVATPGHTSDSQSYLLGTINNGELLPQNIELAFVGDTILIGGLGRTNFDSSSSADLHRSIRHLSSLLDEQTLLCSAHDYNNDFATSIAAEKKDNLMLDKLVLAQADQSEFVRQKEQLDKLFDPFAQAAPSIARQYGGTGLGLSISRRLAEMLGGSISASSVYGEGSQFDVTLSTGPLKDVKFVRDRSELHNQRSRLQVVSAPRLQGRIMYAEDNEVNRRLIKQLVSRTGASLTLVTNGAEALEAGTRNGQDFDLILMDIQMPVMDGRDATQALREAGVNTPIVALTANVMAQDIAEYKEAGCDEVMAKPVEKSPFYQMLERYLEHDGEAEPLDIPRKDERANMPPLSGRILLAEDNADNRLLMARYLAKIGVTTINAENGREAVSTAMRETVDLILMDQHMPEMDGPEAVKLLRQTGFNRPILAFTASDEPEELALMTSAGCNGAIEKPVKLAQLYQTLCQHLPVASADDADTQGDNPWTDPDLLPIVQHFVQGIPERIQSMKEAFKSQDWKTLCGLAHQIKGTAGALGFPDFTEKAKHLEAALKKDDPHGIEGLFDALLNEANQAITGFEQANLK